MQSVLISEKKWKLIVYAIYSVSSVAMMPIDTSEMSRSYQRKSYRILEIKSMRTYHSFKRFEESICQWFFYRSFELEQITHLLFFNETPIQYRNSRTMNLPCLAAIWTRKSSVDRAKKILSD